MFQKRTSEIKLQKLIDDCIRELSDHPEDSEEYAKILSHLEKLYHMKEDLKPSRVSPDTMALITANLVGILMILRYERIDIITSKAMNFVQKPK